jgi:glucose-6-phosphate isomerase
VSTVAPITLDVNGLFDHFAGEHGLRRAEVDAIEGRVRAVLDDIAQRRRGGKLPFFDLPYDDEMISRAGALASELRSSFSTLVVLGIGGSALGTKAAVEAIPPKAGAMRVIVLDNVDPTTIARVLAETELATTCFNVISKSGETAETGAQFLIVRDLLRARFGADGYRRRMIATTDRTSGVLRRIADTEGLRTLPVPQGVGGRFSVLSAVGLLPIAAGGLDIAQLCAGARAMDARTRGTEPWRNPAAVHAAALVLANTLRDAHIHVLMPYGDGLMRLAEWYGQLWAESLGKRRALDGSIVETGQTPVRALGATDQHSQVQLYVEGVRDKVVTFLRVEKFENDLVIPRDFADEDSLAYLGGHTLGALLNMEQRATELALAEAGRLTSVITLPTLDEAAIGQLFHFFEVQTLVAGGLLAIDPLDQPGVEAGKEFTRALAGRRGYEAQAASVEARLGLKRSELVFG